MDMGEAMIAAGIGSARDVSVEDIIAALRAATGHHQVLLSAISVMATGETRGAEPAIAEAARRLHLPLRIMGREALAAVESRTLTRSARSLAVSGTPSLSEAAALAAAGAGARLLGPRLVTGRVTCALACGEEFS
jgi:cobalt-precorrin 5A hydrolase